MRITSGLIGGRTIKSPRGARPTQDRVREAYFSKISSHIANCRFLDLYSGSGAVGIEAWSRGARESILVDSDSTAVRIAQANVETLSANGVKCIRARVELFLENGAGDGFDLIYADPPYVLAEESGFASNLLQLLAKNGWLREGGIVALERRAGPDPELCEGWNLLDARRYGESAVDYYFQA